MTDDTDVHSLVDRLLAEVDRILPLSVGGRFVELTYAAAAGARCCTLLQGMQLLIRADAPEGCGVLLRTMFETFLVGMWTLNSLNDDAYRALARSDYLWEQKHRKALGMPPIEWAANDVVGDEPTDVSERLMPEDVKKRCAAALREAKKPDAFIHNAYRELYGPESFASAHATLKSLDGHIGLLNDEGPFLSLRNSMSGTDETWRLPMAFVMAAGLVHDALDELGASTPELSALAETRPKGLRDTQLPSGG